MRVITTPRKLRWASALLFLCVPMTALETLLVTQSAWRKLPVRPLIIWCAAVFLICCALAFWLTRGKRWAYFLTLAFALAWTALIGTTAFSLHNPQLAFFGLFGVFFFTGLLGLLHHEMGRSFFYPRIKWYQRLPQRIPSMSCEVRSGEYLSQFQVSQIDHEGVFLFLSSHDFSKSGILKEKAELTFQFREQKVRCEAVPVTLLEQGEGVGYQFENLSTDNRKELSDLIENLHGEGYVDALV